MYIGAIACAFFATIFGIVSLVLALLKEKGAMLVSGFNSLPKEERVEYDQARMSRDMRNSCLLWTAIFVVGAVLSYFLGYYMAIMAFVVWLVLFLKDVHLDAEKAFAKYKK